MCNQPGHGVREASEALLRAFQNVGAEHEALAAAESAGTASRQRDTVRRMRKNITDASLLVGDVLRVLATVHGMHGLGLDGQPSLDSAGGPYVALPTVGDPEETLFEALQLVKVILERLDRAYQPGRGAVARRPREMTVVFTGLKDAVAALGCELIARGHDADAAEVLAWTPFLDNLKARACGVLPEQTVRVSAADVTAAILADPAIARAAEAALKETALVGAGRAGT